MDEVGGAIGGAAQGAKIGSAFGPVGTAVGAVLGGLAGLFGGSKKKKARRFAARASAEEQRIRTRAAALERRNLIREAYVARGAVLGAAASESGAIGSSGLQGALSSVASQGRFNLTYFDTQQDNLALRNQYAAKAGKYAQQANEIGSLFQAASGITSLYGSLRDLRSEQLQPVTLTQTKRY